MSTVSTLDRFVNFTDVNTLHSSHFLRVRKGSLVLMEKSSMGLWERFLYALRVFKQNPYSRKSIEKQLRVIEDSSLKVAIQKILLKKKLPETKRKKLSHQIFSRQLQFLQQTVQGVKNIQELSYVQQYEKQLYSFKDMTDDESNTLRVITNQIQTIKSQLTILEIKNPKTQKILQKIQKTSVNDLLSIFEKIESYPASSRLRIVQEMKIRLMQEDLDPEDSHQRREIYFRIAEEFQEAGCFQEAADIFMDIVSAEFEDDPYYLQSAQHLSTLLFFLKNDAQIDVFMQKIEEDIEILREYEPESPVVHTLETIRTVSTFLDNSILDFSNTASVENSSYPFTAHEWKAINILAQKQRGQLCATDDEREPTLLAFSFYILGNQEFNKKTQIFLKNKRANPHVFSVVKDLSTMSYKTSQEYIMKSISVADHFETVYNLKNLRKELEDMHQHMNRIKDEIKVPSTTNQERQQHLHQAEESALQLRDKILQEEMYLELQGNNLQFNFPQKLNEKLSFEEVRHLVSTQNFLFTENFCDNTFIDILDNAGRKINKVHNQISRELYDSGHFASGDIAIRNTDKFTTLTKKRDPLAAVLSKSGGAFGHAALIDCSEGQVKLSELNYEYNTGTISLEEAFTQNYFRPCLEKVLTKGGRKLLSQLMEQQSAHSQDIAQFLRQELEHAIDQLTSSAGNAPIDMELQKALQQVEIPEEAQENLDDFNEWMKVFNEERERPVTLNEFLTPDPESTDKEKEKIKKNLRMQFQERQFAEITNTSSLQRKAFFKSLFSCFDFMSIKRPESIAMKGEKICTQFAMTMLLKAFAQVEHTIKEQLVEHNLIDKKALKKISLFNLPRIGHFTLASLMPFQLIKKLKKMLIAVPPPQIYRDLIDAPKKFFDPYPVSKL